MGGEMEDHNGDNVENGGSILSSINLANLYDKMRICAPIRWL